VIEIAPYRHLAIAPLLAVAVACVIAAAVIAHFSAQGLPRRRLYWSSIVVGLLCAIGSGTVRSARHAGTGTQTEWGWPRVAYTRWVSWEVDERREGVRWQGLAENAVFYGAAALLLGSLTLAIRRESPRRDGSDGPIV
jgi:hypothetical protein